jgi:tetratricopeptide (TPR) repeat protein
MSERRKHLEFLRKTAKEAIWAGDYERALTLYDDGLALARTWKDRDLEDLFTCNRATTLIELERQDFDLSRLKEILLRSPSSYNGVLAGYVAANAHEARGEYGRARFYAQTALTKSRELDLEELTGSSLNLLANLELHEGRFEAACDLFQEAVDRLESEGESLSRHAAVAADNLGYCHIALERLEIGVPLVHRALSVLDSLGARQAMDYPTLDLCFAHVKMNRLEEAESWGIRALGLGKEFGREDVVKNAHYLLAEAYSEMGRASEADEQHEALACYYPDFPALKHYLRQISLMDVINLRA